MRVFERVIRVIRGGFPKPKHIVKQRVRNKTPVSFHKVLTSKAGDTLSSRHVRRHTLVSLCHVIS